MKAKIKLAYRIIIDENSNLTWDKYVFEDTFKEYLMQNQLFNSKENLKTTFRELLRENEKASQLNYLVGIAANGYVQQLKGNLFRVQDVLGKHFFKFKNYELDIINTDITDIKKHKIGITFYSPVLTLIDTINNCFLISYEIEEKKNYETVMFPMQNSLSIASFESF